MKNSLHIYLSISINQNLFTSLSLCLSLYLSVPLSLYSISNSIVLFFLLGSAVLCSCPPFECTCSQRANSASSVTSGQFQSWVEAPTDNSDPYIPNSFLPATSESMPAYNQNTIMNECRVSPSMKSEVADGKQHPVGSYPIQPRFKVAHSPIRTPLSSLSRGVGHTNLNRNFDLDYSDKIPVEEWTFTKRRSQCEFESHFDRSVYSPGKQQDSMFYRNRQVTYSTIYSGGLPSLPYDSYNTPQQHRPPSDSFNLGTTWPSRHPRGSPSMEYSWEHCSSTSSASKPVENRDLTTRQSCYRDAPSWPTDHESRPSPIAAATRTTLGDVCCSYPPKHTPLRDPIKMDIHDDVKPCPAVLDNYPSKSRLSNSSDRVPSSVSPCFLELKSSTNLLKGVSESETNLNMADSDRHDSRKSDYHWLRFQEPITPTPTSFDRDPFPFDPMHTNNTTKGSRAEMQIPCMQNCEYDANLIPVYGDQAGSSTTNGCNSMKQNLCNHSINITLTYS